MSRLFQGRDLRPRAQIASANALQSGVPAGQLAQQALTGMQQRQGGVAGMQQRPSGLRGAGQANAISGQLAKLDAARDAERNSAIRSTGMSAASRTYDTQRKGLVDQMKDDGADARTDAVMGMQQQGLDIQREQLGLNREKQGMDQMGVLSGLLSGSAPQQQQGVDSTSTNDIYQTDDGTYTNAPKFERGGPVQGLRKQGKGPDNIPTWLTEGEYVLPVDTVEQLGEENLDQIVRETNGKEPGGKPSKKGMRGFNDGGKATMYDKLAAKYPTIKLGLDLHPKSGIVTSATDALNEVYKGNYGQAGLELAGVFPPVKWKKHAQGFADPKLMDNAAAYGQRGLRAFDNANDGDQFMEAKGWSMPGVPGAQAAQPAQPAQPAQQQQAPQPSRQEQMQQVAQRLQQVTQQNNPYQNPAPNRGQAPRPKGFNDGGRVHPYAKINEERFNRMGRMYGGGPQIDAMAGAPPQQPPVQPNAYNQRAQDFIAGLGRPDAMTGAAPAVAEPAAPAAPAGLAAAPTQLEQNHAQIMSPEYDPSGRVQLPQMPSAPESQRFNGPTQLRQAARVNHMFDNDLAELGDLGGGVAKTVGHDGHTSYGNIGTEAITDPGKKMDHNRVSTIERSGQDFMNMASSSDPYTQRSGMMGLMKLRQHREAETRSRSTGDEGFDQRRAAGVSDEINATMTQRGVENELNERKHGLRGMEVAYANAPRPPDTEAQFAAEERRFSLINNALQELGLPAEMTNSLTAKYAPDLADKSPSQIRQYLANKAPVDFELMQAFNELSQGGASSLGLLGGLQQQNADWGDVSFGFGEPEQGRMRWPERLMDGEGAYLSDGKRRVIKRQLTGRFKDHPRSTDIMARIDELLNPEGGKK